jgi:hypothetical protein
MNDFSKFQKTNRVPYVTHFWSHSKPTASNQSIPLEKAILTMRRLSSSRTCYCGWPSLLLMFWYALIVPQIILQQSTTTSVRALLVVPQLPTRTNPSQPIAWTADGLSLTAILPPRRPPRRTLPKKKRRRTGGDSNNGNGVDDEKDALLWTSAIGELRPLVSSRQKELGEDYWVDERELAVYEESRRQKTRFIDPGQIPAEKLWLEVLSPYRDNWIGLISVSIVAIAFIFKVKTMNSLVRHGFFFVFARSPK